MIRVMHIIPSLPAHGAEMMLYNILRWQDRKSFSAEVVTLAEEGALAEPIRQLDVPVRALGMRPGSLNPRSVVRLWSQIRRNRPGVIQTWMYHADLIGGLVARLAGSAAVLWNIRHSRLDPGVDKRTTILAARACARISHWLPSRIVCCSESARRAHVEMGYADDKVEVLPNGFDTDRFRPDPSSRIALREELGLPAHTQLIGLVARFHPVKGHLHFIEAARILHARWPAAHFVLCGDGISWSNAWLARAIDAAGLRSVFHLLESRTDIPKILAALDIATSASESEGFPNAVGEAMACGIPCVVTDCGDSALLVGHTGSVVPAKCPAAMAEAWSALLAAGDLRQNFGAAARLRIHQHFQIQDIVQRYQNLYELTTRSAPAFTQELRSHI